MLRRPDLSRVDALLSLVITVLVLGLGLAAVSRVRETAHRTTCQNNLKQLVLAVHNYAGANSERLPPLTDLGDEAPTGRGLMSVFATLVPYIEAGPRYFDAKRSPSAAYHAPSSVVFTYRCKFGTTFTEDGGMANRAWKVFLDPSDETADRLRDVPVALPDGTIGHYAAGSYAVNGLLLWGRRGQAATSQVSSVATVLLTERPQVCRTATGEDVYNLWGLGVYSPYLPAFAALTPADSPQLRSTGQVAPVSPLPDAGAADRDAGIRVRVGRQDAVPCPPDFPTPVQVLRGGKLCDPRLPGSPHTGGLQAAMADGSVRVFERDTSPWVFWTACMAAEPPVGP